MFWKRRSREDAADVNNLDAEEIVSRVGGVYADFNEKGQLIKPRSSLPCSWFAARECFMIAYEREYLQLPEDLRHSYHFVYSELACFVDDELCKGFNYSLNIAAKCRSERNRTSGIQEDEAFCRKYIASDTVKIQDRKEIWSHLASESTCPRQHLLLLAETLVYCGELHRAMYDEWAAFANLIAYQKKQGECV